jgi:putative ABC transport system ATP-binding protein
MTLAAESTPVAISVRGVSKVFGSGKLAYRALTDVDLDVRKGEILMLVGPSGSGKTTLLSILGCVLRPTSGQVELLGESIVEKSEKALADLRLHKIGFVFQAHNLLPGLSIRDNVALPLEVGGQPRALALRRADAVLAEVGLGEKLRSVPGQLSGGQRQRVAIARALAPEPPLIFADEPTAALDADSGLKVTEMLKTTSSALGATVVVVTHDPRIYHLADRTVSIEDGRIQPAPEAA